MRVGLVIPTLNAPDLAIDLIYSAKSKNDLRIYVQPQYRYQVPLAQAWNNGIRQATADGCGVVIVSNDDAIFAPNTVDYLTSMVNDSYDFDGSVMAYPLDVFEAFGEGEHDEILFDEDDLYEVEDKEDQKFSCFAVKSNFFDICGTFDENFDPCWWEDTDMKYRMHLLGQKPLYTNVPYVHLRHQTTNRLTLPINSMKSQQYYEKKWGSSRKDLKEAYIHPYNDSNLSAKDWKKL